jgi:hypothetical protein
MLSVLKKYDGLILASESETSVMSAKRHYEKLESLHLNN